MNWWLIGGAAAGLVLLAKAAKASGPCKHCYDAKSAAYRRCQTFPPEDRLARETCFRTADAALIACLSACKGG